MFEDSQFINHRIIGRAAGGNILHVNAQRVTVVGAAKSGRHGAGVAPEALIMGSRPIGCAK